MVVFQNVVHVNGCQQMLVDRRKCADVGKRRKSDEFAARKESGVPSKIVCSCCSTVLVIVHLVLQIKLACDKIAHGNQCKIM